MPRSRSPCTAGTRLLIGASLCALAFVTPSGSLAGEPPNQNDPCSSAGRNTCRTVGVGFYREYGYGIRWFGDFRRAIPGKAHTFCLDLRYWYASPAYRYREERTGRLRNSSGDLVPLERRRKIAFAIWNYGRSNRPTQQAAVALYVHSLMGDARPGEASPAALGPAVASAYERIGRDAARYHGPYRIETRFAGPLVVGRRTSATIRVVSAEGYALPGVQVLLAARGVEGLPARARVNADGIAELTLTPTDAGQLRLSVKAGPVASTLPRVYRATTAAAAPNAQRLAAPSSQTVSATTTASVTAAPTATVSASAEIVRPGESMFARILVRGLGHTAAGLEVELFGPFATRSAMRCGRRPYWMRRMTAAGDGRLTSPGAKIAKAGFYTYRVRVVSSALVSRYTTECAPAAATSLAAPKIVTGRGDVAKEAPTRGAGGFVPTRVRLTSVGIDARVSAVGIDLATGVLGVPRDIARAGWWKDGMRPGRKAGAILIAGHVDSARGGAGAFFSLHGARAGDRVHVSTANGRTFTYRVVAIRNYRKEALPTSIFSRKGRARLVLVTCGGPFDESRGRYRDNVVVTAVP